MSTEVGGWAQCDTDSLPRSHSILYYNYGSIPYSQSCSDSDFLYALMWTKDVEQEMLTDPTLPDIWG